MANWTTITPGFNTYHGDDRISFRFAVLTDNGFEPKYRLVCVSGQATSKATRKAIVMAESFDLDEIFKLRHAYEFAESHMRRLDRLESK